MYKTVCWMFTAACTCMTFGAVISNSPTTLHAAGGTSIVATKGEPAYFSPSWPEGTKDLVDSPLRTTGWNSWFSEWPNDVHQYAFEFTTTAELNGLIEKLVAIKTDLRQIHLSYAKEPAGLGWVTSLPKGNNIPAIFSIGNQKRIDEWYKQVRKPFGQIEFTAAPVAVPPTLTIFVQNDSVKLDDLKIPSEIEVSIGSVPRVFHRMNSKVENDVPAKSAAQKLKEEVQALDAESTAARLKIEAFIEKRSAAKPKGTLAGGVDASYFVDIDGRLFVTEHSAMIEKRRRDGTLKAQDPTVTIIRVDGSTAVVVIDGETLDATRMRSTKP